MSAVVEEAIRVAGDARHIGEFVRRERLARGLSQVEFASRSGMGQGDVSQMEHGHNFIARPPLTTLQKIARGLARDEEEQGSLFCALLVLAGVELPMLEAVRAFVGAMIRDDAAALDLIGA